MYNSVINTSSITDIRKEFHQHKIIPTHYTKLVIKEETRKAYSMKPNIYVADKNMKGLFPIHYYTRKNNPTYKDKIRKVNTKQPNR